MKAMAKHRNHSADFKRQVAQEFLAGETLHGLAKRHDVSRNLIRVWVAKYEAGAFDDDARAADLLLASPRNHRDGNSNLFLAGRRHHGPEVDAEAQRAETFFSWRLPVRAG
jgi:transposase